MQKAQHQFSALGGPGSFCIAVEPKQEAEGLLREALQALQRFEQRYSRYREDSIVSQINRLAGSDTFIEVDEQCAALLDYAFKLHEQSEGLFDITSGVLRRAWDFKSGKVPHQRDIDKLLPLIGMQHIDWQSPRIRLTKPGMELDFGGFGKEYAADMLASLLRQEGVRHGYVELAGDIAVIGPPHDQPAWPIGISDPQQPAKPLAEIQLRAGGLASSGTYQRCIELDGQRYSHILNPLTGWPIRTYSALSVVQDSCLVAGSLSSIAMLKSCPAGHEWLESLGVEYIAVSDQGVLH